MRSQKSAPDFIIFLTTLMLLSIGIIMVASSSQVIALLDYKDAYYFLKRQLIWALLGVLAMISVMNIDYYRYEKWIGPGFIGTLFLLILVIIPNVGHEVNGSTRWLGIGSLSFQPSEVAKLAIVFFMAKSLGRRHNLLQSFSQGVVPHLVILGVVCGLILLQPDLGTAVAIAGTTYMLLMAAGARSSHLLLLALAGIAVVGLAIYFEPYRMERFLAFLDPWADPSDTGFQTIQSLYAIGSGGLFGLGLGESKQKFLYLPERHTDFIFSIINEELGFIGGFIVICLFFILFWRGYKVALTAPSTFSSLLAVGITSMIALQTVINIGVVTGSMPVTGITLPFISYGGSSLIFTLIGVGILLNISRYTQAK